MSSRLLFWIALGAVSLSSPLRAQFVDTFGGTLTAESANYTEAVSFPSPSSPGATFAINGSGQFQPTSPAGTTTQFYRNDSTLSDTVFGNSVAVEIDNVDNDAAAGLAFATSLSGANFLEFSVSTGIGIAGITNVAADAPGGTAFPVDFSAGPIFESVTRTGDTTLAYTFSGPGLTDGSFSGTYTDAAFAGQNIVFGLDTYSGPTESAGNQIEDNLTFAIPEPSTWLMLLGGLVMLCFALNRLAVASRS